MSSFHFPKPKVVEMLLKKLRTLYPDAQCALDHESPFQLLIATILSAQCTDKRVNLVTPALFQAGPTARTMLDLGSHRLKKLISTCGLYQSKAKNILATCEILLKKYQGEVPQTMEELIQLPGVGRKTANVVLANAFQVPAFAVDTHVFRVSQRLGLAQGKTPEQIEQQLMKVIPQKDWIEGHHLLILHGRHLCLARNPRCEQCPLTKECLYYQKSQSLNSKRVQSRQLTAE